MITFTEGPQGWRLTTDEQDAVAKVENGYMRMDADGELLVVDDTNYFRHLDEQRRQEKLAMNGEMGEAEHFHSEKELARIAFEWPMSRLVEVWNSLAGVTPVKRFADRNKAVARIWKASQKLASTTPGLIPDTPPVKNRSKKTAVSAPVRRLRAGSKKVQVLNLLSQPEGVTLQELMKATGWQAHSVRGFLSGNLSKKMGLHIHSERRPDGERYYRIQSK